MSASQKSLSHYPESKTPHLLGAGEESSQSLAKLRRMGVKFTQTPQEGKGMGFLARNGTSRIASRSPESVCPQPGWIVSWTLWRVGRKGRDAHAQEAPGKDTHGKVLSGSQGKHQGRAEGPSGRGQGCACESELHFPTSLS